MYNLLAHHGKCIPKVVVYLDNTLITGEMDEEHLQIMGEVLPQLETVALQVKKPK